jgi:DNA-binding response OmpR family regulator
MEQATEARRVRRFGDLVLDEQSGRVVLGGKALRLDAVERRILARLIDSPEQLATQRDLVDGAWGTPDPRMRGALDARVARIARLLSRVRGGPTIKRVRLRAFRLVEEPGAEPLAG